MTAAKMRGLAAAPAAAAAAWPGAAFAHAAHGAAEAPWAAWHVTPEVTLATVLVLAVYVAGMRRGARAGVATSPLRHGLFLAGVAVVWLAVQSPIDALGNRVFVVHQGEHMLLRTIGPLLIFLAAPQATVLRGLPRAVRRGAVAPTAGAAWLRRAFAVLAHPATVVALFLAVHFLWMVPRIHDQAILDPLTHEAWHASLLLAGLLFWWRILDPRPRPLGAAYPARLAMIVLAMLGNIALGAYLSLKGQVLYRAYDVAGRLWGLEALDDERLGGLVMWIPGTMMLAMAAVYVVHRWVREEERAEARASRARRPAGGAAAPLPAEGATTRADGAAPRRHIALAAAAIAAAAGLGGAAVLWQAPPQEAGAGGAAIGGPFELVAHTGETVTAADLRGRYLLVYFGFTHCPDVCPTTLAEMSRALDRLGERAERVRPVFITVDPERDGAEAMARYVEHFHPRLLGLTGSPEQVRQAAEQYKVFYEKAPLEDGGYTMNHAARVFLMGPDGGYIANFDASADAAAMAARIAEAM